MNALFSTVLLVKGHNQSIPVQDDMAVGQRNHMIFVFLGRGPHRLPTTYSLILLIRVRVQSEACMGGKSTPFQTAGWGLNRGLSPVELG
ncbi:MAG TPA: hypothetical protein VM260_04595 [Pirellula sp.]|nr:hypothetical protein [Pirellula sp.]